MSARIVFAVCANYVREAQQSLTEEGLEEAVVVSFPARCGRPMLTHDELLALASPYESCEQVVVFGGICLGTAGTLSAANRKVCFHKLEQCFHLVAEPLFVQQLLKNGSYLTTPGWLANWQKELLRMGFDMPTARDFFKESARAITLLDTGIEENSLVHLQAFTASVDRPFEMFPVGISRIRLLLLKAFWAWKQPAEQQTATVELSALHQQTAQYAMALDLLSNLSRTMTEEEAIQGVLDVFVQLFAPARISYSQVHGSATICLYTKPPEISTDEQEAIKKQLADYPADREYSIIENGFLLRIESSNESHGILLLEEIAFPQYLHRYLNLALSIAHISKLPLENARRYEKLLRTEADLRSVNAELHQVSTTDALTGIANRRAYDTCIDHEWRRMLRHRTSLALILCDIDFFKKYNDFYGHEAGDVCLRMVAQMIKGTALRPGDFVGRYGGEEFVCILAETSAEGAYHVAENIRIAVEELKILHQPSTVSPHITVSLGVAIAVPPFFPHHSSNDLFRTADEALYEAKLTGRNCVVSKRMNDHRTEPCQ